MMNKAIEIIIGIMIIVCIIAVMYGAYWLAKNVSYTFFYKDMVIETIQETVKQSSLK
ncbi:MAG: hypothetical protein ABUK08_00200 [Candidatus Humimicrobiaceae bacterium]